MKVNVFRAPQTTAATERPRKSPELRAIERKLYAGDAFVGAVQGIAEGACGLFASSGSYGSIALGLGVGVSIAVQKSQSKPGSAKQHVALSALRSAAYAGAGLLLGPSAGPAILGVGVAVGAGWSVLETRAELNRM